MSNNNDSPLLTPEEYDAALCKLGKESEYLFYKLWGVIDKATTRTELSFLYEASPPGMLRFKARERLEYEHDLPVGEYSPDKKLVDLALRANEVDKAIEDTTDLWVAAVGFKSLSVAELEQLAKSCKHDGLRHMCRFAALMAK